MKRLEFHQLDEKIIDRCVHCGFCLPSCPTYRLTGNEAESPRGRIDLLRLLGRGDLVLDSEFVAHIDSCLGCLSCVSACPSGVQFDELILQARSLISMSYRRNWGERISRAAIFAVMPYPRRMRTAMWGSVLADKMRLGALLQGKSFSKSVLVRTLLASLELASKRSLATARRRSTRSGLKFYPGLEPRRGRVGLLKGCAGAVLFENVERATIEVLQGEGFDVLVPERQGCCGALAHHSGELSLAAKQASQLLGDLSSINVDSWITTAAGCGSTLKSLPEVLALDGRPTGGAESFSAAVVDVSEFLDSVGLRGRYHGVTARVSYHPACHLVNAQQISRQPISLLESISGLTVIIPPDANICCGSAGTFNLLHPGEASALGVAKVAAIMTTDPDVIAAANPGCLLQIAHYCPGGVAVVHPVELLALSMRGGDIEELRESVTS